MEMSSSPTSGMFSLQVLIILGITVALVSAVAVILYNKIQQQGEKISAVMELSTVIAQELRSHDTVLQHLQSRDNPTFVGSSPPHVGQSGSVSQSGYSNIVLSSPENNNDSMLVYVSDGSCNSSDDESDNEGKLKISQIPSTTLDNMLMNPMCFGHPSPPDIIDSESDESGESGESDESDESDEGEYDSESDMSSPGSIADDDVGESMNTPSDHTPTVIDLDSPNDVVEIVETDIENLDPPEKRVITLSEISISEPIQEISNDLDPNVHTVVVDSGDNAIDYKKLGVNDLKRLAVERKLLDKGSKMKKMELIELLTNV
jgi:hypothetical protein